MRFEEARGWLSKAAAGLDYARYEIDNAAIEGNGEHERLMGCIQSILSQTYALLGELADINAAEGWHGEA